MDYNPYDLIPTLVNGKEFQSRPIEFDSEVVDNNNMTNAFGSIVKPTKVSTSCPDCGQGLEFDCTLEDPPFALSVVCYHCRPAPPPAADPFMNPLEEGRVGEHELDPLLHNPSEQVVDEADDSSVADRMNFPDDEEGEEAGVASHGADALLVPAPVEETPPAEEPATPTIAELDAVLEEETAEPDIPESTDPKPTIAELDAQLEEEAQMEVPPTDDVKPLDGPEMENPLDSDLPIETPPKAPEATEEAPKVETPSEPQDAPEVKEEPKEEAKKPTKKPTKKAAPKKTAKKKTPKKSTKKKVPVEPADGLTEEVDIDEDDLTENE